MELGQRLRQARQAAGLSQRQLCGDQITRNMLSQIENGSARPSMETLRYLAKTLGKPVSWFLQEDEALRPNEACILQALEAPPRQALQILTQYREPDALLDGLRWLLQARACLALAETAIGENKLPYACSLLEQAGEAGRKTPLYTPETERKRLLLCYQAGQTANALIPMLPSVDAELLLRGQGALEAGDADRCIRLLDAAEAPTPAWYMTMGKAYMAKKDFAKAAQYLQKAPGNRESYTLLETCFSAMEDYKQAYFYACKLREDAQ